MKKRRLLIAFAAFASLANLAQAETLYFFSDQSSNRLWNNLNSWYVTGPNPQTPYTLAGRLPVATDDVVIGAICDATGITQPLVSMTIWRINTTLTGGDFDLGGLNFSDSPGGGGGNASIGVFGTRFNIRASASINFTTPFVGINASQIILQGGSFANVTIGPGFTGTTIFNEGSFVIQGTTNGANTVSFFGSGNRFDNIGDIRGNGGMSALTAGFHNLTLNNSGTIRADNGTLFINGIIDWTAEDTNHDGSFYPFTNDAIINITGAFVVPANTTTYFKGPGTVNTLSSVTLNGTLQVGVPASGPKKLGPAPAAPGDPAIPGNYTFAQAPGGSVAEMSGPGNLIIRPDSVMNWTTGSIQGNFSGLIDVHGTLSMKGASANGTDSIVMNSGNMRFGAGAIWLGLIRDMDAHNAKIDILSGATFTSQFPMSFTSNGSPIAVLNNFGTMNVLAGTSENPLIGFNGIRCNNDGIINITGIGSFHLTGGAATGTFDVAESVDLIIASNPYAIFAGVIFPGDGDIVVARSGTLVAQNDFTLKNLVLGSPSAPGTIDGPGALTVTNKFTYNFGYLKGFGSLSFGSNCLASIVGTFDKAIEARSVNNSGSVQWTGAGNIQVSSGATWKNLTGGVFDLQSDAGLSGGDQDSFENEEGATLKKSAGTGTSTVAMPFTNRGTIEVLIGKLAVYKFLQAGGITHLLGGSFSNLGGTPNVFDAGYLMGSGMIFGDCMNHGATINPGDSPGKITINGDFTQDGSGTLIIEIAGVTTPGVDYDLLEVTGTATLGGNLQIADLSGFTPGPNDTVTPLTAGSISGTFDYVNAQTSYSSTAVTAAALPFVPAQLLNISTRMQVLIGDNVLIGGFIVSGTDAKKVIIRGIGPSLPVGIKLQDTVLELHDSTGAIIATNDDWREHQAEVEATTIPPTNDKESAIVATLPANNSAYTAILKGKNNNIGVGLVEVYDLDQAANSKLANISTRGFVDLGDNVMIGGLIIGGGSSGGTAQVIVRAIGPSLPVGGALQDPTLELHNGSGALIAFNDNWRTDQEAEVIATTIPPTKDAESAIVRTLTPGNYTAIVRGVGNTTGIGLVEVYNLH